MGEGPSGADVDRDLLPPELFDFEKSALEKLLLCVCVDNKQVDVDEETEQSSCFVDSVFVVFITSSSKVEFSLSCLVEPESDGGAGAVSEGGGGGGGMSEKL